MRGGVTVTVVTGIFPPDIGGPATYVPFLADGLVARGHEVRVVTTAAATPGAAVAAGRGWDVTAVPRRSPLWRVPRIIREVFLKASVSDGVFAVSMHLEAAIGAALARRPLVVKVVGDFAWERARTRGWTTTGFDDFQRTPQARRVELLKRIRTWSLRRADAVIVPSEYLRDAVVSWGVSADRCRVVYNAVAGAGVSAARVARREGDPLRVITVCRLVPWKGVDLLLRAIAQVPGSELTIVGDGPLRATLESVARDAGVGARVRFLGTIPPEAVREELRRHDVFALASTYEGLPHVVLEAMQERLAVLATRAGGTPEVVVDSQTGLLVDADLAPIVQGLRRLQADPALAARLVDGACARLATRFSEETMIDETEAVLLASAAGSAAPAAWVAGVQGAG
jgi:glycosyltransferase involved in cell wall biosynthesis